MILCRKGNLAKNLGEFLYQQHHVAIWGSACHPKPQNSRNDLFGSKKDRKWCLDWNDWVCAKTEKRALPLHCGWERPPAKWAGIRSQR